MKVGLFIPCYIDQFYPKVAVATMELLEKYGCEVEYPLSQTCCGQPLANSGYATDTRDIMENFTKSFQDFEFIVCPSGSCTLHVKEHLETSDKGIAASVKENTYELVEFLHDILRIEDIDATFQHKVGLHASCHGLRGLGLASQSELNIPPFNKTSSLLKKVKGIELVELDHADECCGFGGTFAVLEEALSVKMGKDRIKDHESHGAEVIAGNDMSCLMHLEGILRRNKSKTRVMHIAEILNGSQL